MFIEVMPELLSDDIRYILSGPTEETAEVTELGKNVSSGEGCEPTSDGSTAASSGCALSYLLKLEPYVDEDEMSVIDMIEDIAKNGLLGYFGANIVLSIFSSGLL